MKNCTWAILLISIITTISPAQAQDKAVSDQAPQANTETDSDSNADDGDDSDEADSAAEKLTFDQFKEKQRSQAKQARDKLAAARAKQLAANDKEKVAIIDAQNAVLVNGTDCYNKEDRLEVEVCLKTSLKKLAQDGNFIAQEGLGALFEDTYQDYQAAINWYTKAMNNPKTPTTYKKVLSDEISAVGKE